MLSNINLHVFIYIYQNIIYPIFFDLYSRGPALFGYGFYEGKTLVDICQTITNVNSDFWKNNYLQCEMMINKKVEAFIIGIFWGSFIFFIYKSYSIFMFRYLIVQPFISKLEILNTIIETNHIHQNNLIYLKNVKNVKNINTDDDINQKDQKDQNDQKVLHIDSTEYNNNNNNIIDIHTLNNEQKIETIENNFNNYKNIKNMQNI